MNLFLHAMLISSLFRVHQRSTAAMMAGPPLGCPLFVISLLLCRYSYYYGVCMFDIMHFFDCRKQNIHFSPTNALL